ncbi:mitochondrial ribosomal protein S25 [Podospora australis]|uniref:Small ribosomal subunit protein mS23 n=1 Tax=Podospora australis TaxID=1536484 RepID=A0AAN6X0H0_9PEZI|nr:mitochondrial ribosomal protein S25 [Podospora australis]
MGRPRQLLAARVWDSAQELLATNIVKDRLNPPAPWIAALANIPPSEVLTRPYPIQHQNKKVPTKGGRRAANLYRPTKIIHPEDKLRQQFYSDHPWELARPMMVLEIDGKDARTRDWSKGVQQPGMKLSGECVVQRQLYLMEVEGKKKREAYDIARKEFYKLREMEEIENRIALEEARAYGAYFGKNFNQAGMDVEDQQFNAWKKWAQEEIERVEAEKTAAYANIVDVPEGEGEDDLLV